MERLTEYRSGIATPVPELYLMAVQENIPQENWNNYIIKKLSEKLARLEDLQDQWRLPELPCAVGDKLYEPRPDREIITEYRVISITYSGNGWHVGWLPNSGIYSNLDGVSADKIGKTVFLTLKEAEEALERMCGNE